MSPRAVIAAVAITLGLAIVAIVLTNKQTPAPTGAQTVALSVFQPGLISAITVKRGDGREERVARTEAGEWRFSAGRVEWPALPPETVGAALAALPTELTKQADATPAPGGPTITLAFRDGSAVVLRLAPASLGGRTPAVMTSSAGESNVLIENSVLDPLLNPGPAGWRATGAIPGVGSCSRITLDDGRSPIALAKVEGAWSMRRPIAARASQGAVELLLSALGEIKVARFEDASAHDLAAMGLTKPILTITAETDERFADSSGEVRVRSMSRELLVGGPADPKGDTRFASADADGSILFVIPAAAVNALSLSARNYINPTAAAVSPADVAMITISDTSPSGGGAQRGYRRDSGGWSVMRADGSRGPAEAGPIEELLEFLASRPGEPEPFRPDDEIRTLRKIELLDGEGDPQEILTAGYTADGQFAVRSGNLLVTYSASAAPALLDLPAFASLPPERPAPAVPTLPATAPTGK